MFPLAPDARSDDGGNALFGTPAGARRIRTTLHDTDDVDRFRVVAAAGNRVTFKVRPRGGAAVVADVLGPGRDVVATAAPKGRGLRARFDAVTSGAYVLRVRPADGGVGGDVDVTAHVKGSGDVRLRGFAVAGTGETEVPFAAPPGARLSFRVNGRSGAPNLVRIETPLGGAVVIPEGVVRRTSTRLSAKRVDLPVAVPYGEWRLVLAAPLGTLDGLKLKIDVRKGGLAAARGRLDEPEPRLLDVQPREAGPGTPLTVLLRDALPPVRLFVGGVEVADVRLSGDGRTLTGEFPHRLTGLLDVAVLANDGSTAALPSVVAAVPPPVVTAIDPVRGPASGGTVVELAGSDFRSGAAVTVDGTPFPANTEFVSSTLLRFVTPAFAAGEQVLGVRDPTGQESVAPTAFEFVAAPAITDVRPPLVPALPNETLRIDGTSLAPGRTVALGGVPATLADAAESSLLARVPTLALGAHDVVVIDDLGQSATRTGGVTVFGFEVLHGVADTGGDEASALALSDFDDDGDLDVFVASPGGATLAAGSLLRVLRNDGDGVYVDVTDDVMPSVVDDDWRGDTVVFGDVAADVGAPLPDGFPDLVIGSLDETVLPAGRSRTRILANRAAPGGGRRFVDRTSTLMAAPATFDDWRAADLWIGDLDGDGGLADIVATHDETPFGESPLTPYYVYHLSGTRVFSFAAAGGYGRFAHQAQRFPTVLGTRVPTTGFPQCVGDDCADDYVPFRGGSLAVADFDDDGRLDVAVTAPDVVTVQGNVIASTQIARNTVTQWGVRMVDRTADVSVQIDPLRGDIVLAGDVTGDGAPDLVVVSRTAPVGIRAVSIAEFRGFGSTWAARTSRLPERDGDEGLQADDAALADIDGDGDLDLVLLTRTAPTSGSTASGRGLRVLRNLGAAGFSRALEDLLPSVAAAGTLTGTALAVGTGAAPGAQPEIVIARRASGSTSVTGVRRDASE